MKRALAVVVPVADLIAAGIGAAVGFALTLWLFADDQEQSGIGLTALAGATVGALLCLAPVTLVLALDPLEPIAPVDPPATDPPPDSPSAADGAPAISEQEARVA